MSWSIFLVCFSSLQDAVGVTEQAFPSADIKGLQEQNSTLRAVIAEMRREMEALNYQAISSVPSKMKTADVDKTDSATVSFTPGNEVDWDKYLLNSIGTDDFPCISFNRCFSSPSVHFPFIINFYIFL